MKRKILIVEDNVGLSQIQKDWLSRAGYDAVTAMSEPIARSLIRKTQFDLILSDVRLPEGDGISLLEWLRKEKKDIPFIITTEFVSVPDVVRTIKLGARDYLPKPVHREHLLELAEDVFHPVATVRKQERQLFRRISPMILKVEKFARLVAPSDMSVMILGANGTAKSKSLRCNNTYVRRGECLAEDTAVIYIYRFVCQSIQTVITFLEDRDSNFMTDSCTLSRICINSNFTFINNCVKFILNLCIENFTDMFDLEACSKCIFADTDSLHISLSCMVYTFDTVDVVMEDRKSTRLNSSHIL